MRIDFPLRRLILLRRLRKKKVSIAFLEKDLRIHNAVRCYIGKKCRELTIGKSSEIRRHSDIEVNGKLSIGSNVTIGVRAFIQADGEVTIGDGVLLGPDVKIFSTTHQYGSNLEIHKPLIKGNVFIGNNVWIGSGAIISKDVTIGDNAVIGANSFVNSDVPKNSVVAGSPAKVIKLF